MRPERVHHLASPQVKELDLFVLMGRDGARQSLIVDDLVWLLTPHWVVVINREKDSLLLLTSGPIPLNDLRSSIGTYKRETLLVHPSACGWQKIVFMRIEDVEDVIRFASVVLILLHGLQFPQNHLTVGGKGQQTLLLVSSLPCWGDVAGHKPARCDASTVQCWHCTRH